MRRLVENRDLLVPRCALGGISIHELSMFSKVLSVSKKQSPYQKEEERMIKRKYCHSLFGHRESNPRLRAAIGQIVVYKKPLEVVRGTPCRIIEFFGEWVIASAMN
jgi:hypothetical protein